MPSEEKTKASELEEQLPAAIGAVTECAAQMGTEATGLQERLKTLRVPEPLGDEAAALALSLEAQALGALAVLNELRAATESGYLNAAEVLRVLTEIDARLVRALAGLADLSGRLEQAVETDERCEPAYLIVIETAGRLLQGFQEAQAATRALRDAMSRRRAGR